ncbi:unnamed protein product [Angiostrongylus costaricensis]|uniref:7TM_GPCR_Srx domain-containing protein n=1 Tax=Angiostrongylus costaricensis TaxID=334426 RepID=A0A0R3Q260_ANGCS|nr:unnamed protein product [Angiostrongylus costaricensis]
MVKCENPFHDHFFVFYIFFGSILLVLNLQTMLVIRRSKCLWAHSAYRLIFFSSAADAVNCGVQVAAVAITLRTPVIHPTLNSLLGALFHTSYAMGYPTIFVLAFNRFIAVVFPKKMDLVFDKKKTMLLGALFHTSYAMGYPTIFVLAFNRFIAVVFPKKMDLVFDKKKTMIILILCCVFGAFTGALCPSGEIRSMWDPYIPKFYFTKTTHQICARRASAPVALFPDIYAVGNLALFMVLSRF